MVGGQEYDARLAEAMLGYGESLWASCGHNARHAMIATLRSLCCLDCGEDGCAASTDRQPSRPMFLEGAIVALKAMGWRLSADWARREESTMASVGTRASWAETEGKGS
jgi:hypothetical protein